MPNAARLRFVMKDQNNNQRYLVCRHGIWQLTTDSLTPLALCNIAGDNAAKLSFALDDAYEAEDPDMAMAALIMLAKYAKDIDFI
jgi:hypothetical protein